MKKLTKCAGTSGIGFSLLMEVNGPIEAVDADNSKIRINGRTYKIRQDAVIEMRLSLSKLSSYVGTQVELELDKENAVYRIELDRD